MTSEGASDAPAGATIEAAVADEVGMGAGSAVANEAMGVGVMVAGVPAAADGVDLTSVALGTTLAVLPEQAAIRTIPATIHGWRTRRG